MGKRVPLIAGNWKMYKTRKEAAEFARRLKELYEDTGVRAAIIAPYTQLDVLKEELKGTGVGVGAQNVHYEDEGAFTGEISLQMLKELDVDYCIAGHSERRQYFSETDEAVNLKVKKLLRNSEITPILCVGEALQEREEGKQEQVVKGQLERALKDLKGDEVSRMVIAYEPVWAIGSGRTASPEQADRMCALIRRALRDAYGEDTCDKVSILYGGSVKPENASHIMAMDEIDGALVGGASLDPDKFMEMIKF